MAAKTTSKKRTQTPKASGDGGRELVIVESPTKARTIRRILGRRFDVRACMGHVRDLPQKEFGVDIEKGFEPVYVLLPGKEKLITALKPKSERAETVYLATDLDREGEAIAWHLKEALDIPDEKVRRVIFHEITYPAVKKAFQEPREISMDKVDAQQARRILDRIVGYQLSELLWKKIFRGLSAGRVQSVAVRLIVERERAIADFMAEEYWRLFAQLKQQAVEKAEAFAAEVVAHMGEKVKPVTGSEARGILAQLEGESFRVKSIREEEKLWHAKPPLITSTLQQSASIRYHLSASQTMRIAQQLYEGIKIPKEGQVGLITYMRTDSVRVSSQALKQVRGFIKENFSEGYLPAKARFYRLSPRAQAAHEAIRPTQASRTPENLKPHLTRQQFQIYELVWKQFVASQMAPARFSDTDCEIEAGDYVLRAQGRTLLFDGYLKVMGYQRPRLEKFLPALTDNEELSCSMVIARQLFTEPPPRYTEASLIKTLEQLGIGRPSTYAPIVSTIQKRGYVQKNQNRFYATDLGMVVTDKLVNHFPKIMDPKFTSTMEEELDEVEEARLGWKRVLDDFYRPFSEELEKAKREMPDAVSDHASGIACELCGKPMVYRWSNRKRFLGCSGYPECKHRLPVNARGEVVEPKAPEKTDELCKECGAHLVIRTGRYGEFLSCSRFPECTYTRSLKSTKKRRQAKTTGVPCPKKGCEGTLVKRKGPRGSFYGCSNFPRCSYTTNELPASSTSK